MADKKISDLTSVTSLADGDLFEIENAGGNSRKVASSVLRTTVLISEVVTSGSQTNVTFSSIATTWRDLLVVVRGRGTAAALSVSVSFQFNSDTGNNYQFEKLRYSGTSSSISQSTGVSSISTDDLPAASATANFAGWVEARILDYRGTTFYKTVHLSAGSHLGTSANTNEVGIYSGQWNSTSAINAVKVFPSSGAFVDGSVVSLYGIL